MCADMYAIHFSKCFILQTVSYKVARKVGRSFMGEFNTVRLLVRYNKKRGLHSAFTPLGYLRDYPPTSLGLGLGLGPSHLTRARPASALLYSFSIFAFFSGRVS